MRQSGLDFVTLSSSRSASLDRSPKVFQGTLRKVRCVTDRIATPRLFFVIIKRGRQCPTAPKVLGLAEASDAQLVMASLVSSGTTRGEPSFVPRSASMASEFAGKVTAIGWAGSRSPWTSCEITARGLHDDPDLTTRQCIFKDSTDFAPRCRNHDRPSDCRSA